MANPYGLQIGLATMLAQQMNSAHGRGGQSGSRASGQAGGQGATGSTTPRPAPIRVPIEEGRSLRVLIGNAIGNPRWHEEFSKFFVPPSEENRGVVRDQKGIVQYRLRAAEGSGLQGEMTLQRKEDGRYGLLVNGREVSGVVFIFDPKNQRFFLLEGDQGAIKNALADLKATPTTPPSGQPMFLKPRYRAMQPAETGAAPRGDAPAVSTPTESAPKSDSEQGGSLLETLLPLLVMSMLASRGGASNAQSSLPSVFVV